MKRFSMEIIKKFAMLAVAALGFVACADEVDNNPVNPSEQIEEVGFSMPVDVTRTTIGEDGKITNWSVGDKLAAWAVDAEGAYTFQNAMFTLRYFSTEYTLAYFTSNIEQMAEGNYTYYLSYPTPNAVDGTKATYSLPATQTGKYEGGYDIMIAEPVEAEALTSSKKMVLNTSMRHQMHALKITIPEKASNFADRVYSLEITFPNDVVGDVTLDVTNPNAEPVYSNTSNTIIVKSDEGFAVGSDIWVFVLPGMVSGDVSYKLKGLAQRSEVATYAFERELERGHVTPIRMAMPPFEKYTALHFSIGENHLGEEFNYFTLYDNNGTNMGTYYRNAENRYTVEYNGEFDAANFSNTNWTLVFDSDNAIVENSVNLGTIKPYFEQSITPVDVPYLLFQDFQNVSEEESNGNNSYQSSDRNQPGVALSGELAGWNGARFWIKPGAARINSRYQCTKVIKAFSSMHHGRLDTPTLGDCGLKPGKEPYIMVSFDAALNRNSSSSLDLKEGAINLATHTNGSNPIDGIPTGSTGITSSYDTTLADFGTTYFTRVLANETGNDAFGQSFPTYTTTDFRATSDTRLCFYPTLSPTSDKTGNIEINVYVDNIRVWIAQ